MILPIGFEAMVTNRYIMQAVYNLYKQKDVEMPHDLLSYILFFIQTGPISCIHLLLLETRTAQSLPLVCILNKFQKESLIYLIKTTAIL